MVIRGTAEQQCSHSTIPSALISWHSSIKNFRILPLTLSCLFLWLSLKRTLNGMLDFHYYAMLYNQLSLLCSVAVIPPQNWSMEAPRSWLLCPSDTTHLSIQALPYFSSRCSRLTTPFPCWRPGSALASCCKEWC